MASQNGRMDARSQWAPWTWAAARSSGHRRDVLKREGPNRMSTTPHPTLEDAKSLMGAASALLDRSVTAARELTDGGQKIDDHQVITERVAYAATEAIAAKEVIASIEAQIHSLQIKPGATPLIPIQGINFCQVSLCTSTGAGRLDDEAFGWLRWIVSWFVVTGTDRKRQRYHK